MRKTAVKPVERLDVVMRRIRRRPVLLQANRAFRQIRVIVRDEKLAKHGRNNRAEESETRA